MKRERRTVIVALALVAVLPLAGQAAGAAGSHGQGRHAEPDPGAMEAMARHGGQVQMVGRHHFEVVFEDHGLHVLPMDAEGEPLRPRVLSGTVRLKARRRKDRVFPLEPMRDEQGRVSALMLERDFSEARDGTRKAVFELHGLGETKRFAQVLRRAEGGMGGSSHAGSHSDAAGNRGEGRTRARVHETSLREQRRRYPLSWCVVSGEKLGDDPVEHVHQGRLVRFCCPACTGTFEQDPGKYLRKLDRAARGQAVKRPAGSGGMHGGH